LGDGARAILRILVTVDAAGVITNTAVETQTTSNPTGRPTSSVLITAKAKGTPVPPAHTGEPWSSPLYWWFVGILMAAGASIVELARRRRRLLPVKDTAKARP
jgi:hypothetical protein